ncbi:MAG TPA: alpha/beta hydrolase [Chthoniobacterales bacterium]|nr:alpha/beta hydrolase [Chthoniobacterales bacterium]
MKAQLGVVTWLIAAAVAGAADTAGVSRTTQLDGAKVHYTEYGSGDRTLLFVHGWACDESFWSGQAPALGAKFHVITIDLPGHGQSDKPQIAYTMDLYARAIDAVLRDAKVNAATLIAHSNGTPVVRQFYRKFPGKTRGLVIVDGALRPFGDKAMMEKFVARLKAPNYEETAGKFVDNITSPIQDGALREKIKAAMLRTPQSVAVSEMEATLDPELWKPDKIDVPVLMILAKQPAWSAEYEQFVRSIVPDLDYQVWENVSHFLMMEQPEKFNRAVETFVEKRKL